MNRSNEEIQKILSAFRTPDRARYPELNGYSRDECYQDFFGGGVYIWLSKCPERYV
jgi:hypothetical protein